MPSIRKTKTASGATAVQVVRYRNRKLVVMKHVGSAHTEEEIRMLMNRAHVWLEQEDKQTSLFKKTEHRSTSLATARYEGVTYSFAHTVLVAVAERCGFTTNRDTLLLDLAFMRLIEPASKLRSIELLKRYFGIHYAERTVYRALPAFEKRKVEMETIAVACATRIQKEDLAIVLYDVTTLYFETFASDELRVPGFSKDSKSQQPQIVVGLLVTRTGFPLGYEVFKGNTFEGKTMIPVLEAFAVAHGVTTPTVVADAAMLSHTNVAELKSRNLSYIVGARTGSCSTHVIEKAATALGQKDGTTVRMTSEHGDLIFSFSAKRYRKDTFEMEKQVARGRALVLRNEPGRRAKFVKKKEGDEYIIDEALIEKTKLLLGMKGYYTNIPATQLSDTEVIARYHDLWHVEAAFRMAKSDLATRPIFHHKEAAVRAHMVICFVALIMGRYIERRTRCSLRQFVDMLWSVTDARIVDTETGEVHILRSPVGEDIHRIIEKIGVSY